MAWDAIGVVGPADCSAAEYEVARRIGLLLAEAGVLVVTGGLGGVMEAASRGAGDGGGISLGLLPGLEASAANPFVNIRIPTGLGELRNGLLVRASAALVAIGGSWGTLSEIALARRDDKPVVCVGAWQLSPPGQAALTGVRSVSTADEAVRMVLTATGIVQP